MRGFVFKRKGQLRKTDQMALTGWHLDSFDRFKNRKDSNPDSQAKCRFFPF